MCTTIMRNAFSGISIMLFAGIACSALNAQDRGDRPIASVLQIEENAPIIDGRLDDAIWANAKTITNFFQKEPVEGDPVSERTEVRIIADGEALYVGAWLYDRTPDQIVLGERVRDANLKMGDYFSIILDTYQDRQNGFIFSTTPASIEYDGQVVREGQGGGLIPNRVGQTRQQAGAMGGFNLNWDADWEVAASRDGEGWYAEFRIPFSTLSYAGGSSLQTWGINMVRGIRRHNEEAFWAPIPRQYDIMRLSLAGDLNGVPVPARRAATVTPFVLGSAQRNYTTEYGRKTRFDQKLPREIGIDAKITLTSSLTLDLTTNTDFAQVEVDEQRTNLTRFSMFFPEKRGFFLENAGTFTAGTPQAIDLFFSRRIGLSDNGNVVPILGGARLSGKIKGLGVGLMQMFTDGLDPSIEAGVQKNSFTVARVTKELEGRSRIGAMFVQRRATGNEKNYNRTYSVDGRVGLGDKVTYDTWVARTETPGRGGNDFAQSHRVEFRSRDVQVYGHYMMTGEDFNPEVGFLDRQGGYRTFTGNILKLTRSSVPWIREFDTHLTYRAYWELGGFEQSSILHFDTEILFENGGKFGPEFNLMGEGVRAPFEIAPGVVIQPGSYDFFQTLLDFGTDPSAPVALAGSIKGGSFFAGHQAGGNASLTYRQGSALSAGLALDHQIVRLPEGNFETTLVGMRFGYFFTPRIFLQSLVQYSDQANTWGANVRFGLLDTAGTGLYIVYNGVQNSYGLTQFKAPRGRAFTIKYSKNVRIF
jgi:hypothetical protein